MRHTDTVHDIKSSVLASLAVSLQFPEGEIKDVKFANRGRHLLVLFRTEGKVLPIRTYMDSANR